MRMLLKTISKVLPQHMGKHLAPTDQLVTPGKRPAMSAKPAAFPAVNHEGTEILKTPFAKQEAPATHLANWKRVAGIQHQTHNVPRWLHEPTSTAQLWTSNSFVQRRK